MKTLLVLMLLLAVNSFAQSPDRWVFRSAVCVSGEFNAEGSLPLVPNAIVTDSELNDFKVALGNNAKILDVPNYTLVILPASGDNNGACKNSGKPTVLIFSFGKYFPPQMPVRSRAQR